MCEEVLGPKDPRWAVISPIRGACFEVASLSVYTVDKRGIVDNVSIPDPGIDPVHLDRSLC